MEMNQWSSANISTIKITVAVTVFILVFISVAFIGKYFEGGFLRAEDSEEFNSLFLKKFPILTNQEIIDQYLMNSHNIKVSNPWHYGSSGTNFVSPESGKADDYYYISYIKVTGFSEQYHSDNKKEEGDVLGKVFTLKYSKNGGLLDTAFITQVGEDNTSIPEFMTFFNKEDLYD